MKRILVVLMLLAVGISPAHAQTEIDGFRVPFMILVAPEHVRLEGPKCYVATSAGWENATLEAAPTPYGEVVSDSLFGGRMVTAAQSPILGTEGCLLEYKLNMKPAESYSLQLVVNDRPNDWAISLGEMPIGDIIQRAPKGIIYYFDADTFATGSDTPEPLVTTEATPNADNEVATVSLLVMVTDPELWKPEGAGCVGETELSWLVPDASIIISSEGTTSGQTGSLGIGNMFVEDTCTWSFPKTPPLADNGAFRISIDDHQVECSTEDMSKVGGSYVAAVSIDEDGIQCASVT